MERRRCDYSAHGDSINAETTTVRVYDSDVDDQLAYNNWEDSSYCREKVGVANHRMNSKHECRNGSWPTLNLFDVGSSVIAIEHGQDVIALADWVIDLGPGAGQEGGTVQFEGIRSGKAMVDGLREAGVVYFAFAAA
jgi:hypothetical protein